MAKDEKPRHESYMCFEVVEADNGFLMRVSIPNREDPERLIVWQSEHTNSVEAFAQFLSDLADHFGPVDEKKKIYVAVGPTKSHMN